MQGVTLVAKASKSLTSSAPGLRGAQQCNPMGRGVLDTSKSSTLALHMEHYLPGYRQACHYWSQNNNLPMSLTAWPDLGNLTLGDHFTL